MSSCFYHFYRSIHLPRVAHQLDQQMILFREGGIFSFSSEELNPRERTFILGINGNQQRSQNYHLSVQFHVLFVSLFLWPDVPCDK